MALPTPFGEFEARAFECASGFVYLALVRGVVTGQEGVLTRLHSECLTGDTLGSLRCDCGLQLRMAFRTIAAESRGVLLYATGQEGRGIGLINKLRAYARQDAGADTLDANLELGLPVDARDYRDAAAVLAALAPRSVRLLTNNPDKVRGLRDAGIVVRNVEPLPVASHLRNRHYLRTKTRRMGHVDPTGTDLPRLEGPPPDVARLLGRVEPQERRPHIILKYAQTLDGRIATANGDSKWISGQQERRISHGLRAACDAVLVGVGTAIRDDPQLTVRMVPGVSPIRVVLDSMLRIPPTARLLQDDAATMIVTTTQAPAGRRAELCKAGIAVRVVEPGPGGVDIEAALALLLAEGIRSVLVEGGSRVITSLLGAGVVDRLVVAVAPTIIGSGVDAVGDLGIASVADGMRLVNACLTVASEDVVLAWDVERRFGHSPDRDCLQDPDGPGRALPA